MHGLKNAGHNSNADIPEWINALIEEFVGEVAHSWCKICYYIEREYTIVGNHPILTSEHTVREIEQKAKKVVGMLKRGIRLHQRIRIL